MILFLILFRFLLVIRYCRQPWSKLNLVLKNFLAIIISKMTLGLLSSKKKRWEFFIFLRCLFFSSYFRKFVSKLNGGLKKCDRSFIILSPSSIWQNFALNFLMWVTYLTSTFDLVIYLFGLSRWTESIYVELYFNMIMKLSLKNVLEWA